ncbi:MAG: hypothetical protein JXK05_09280 [Campylobacterales bacterium]|nr:hypothetical protein [Campylobacterales bacterium]
MKSIKMSLAAVMLLGASAYALENTKIGGSAQLFYHSTDSGDVDMFDKDASNADAALHVNVSADLTSGISAGASYTAISTLGLENNLVSNTWSSAHKIKAGTGQTFGAAAGGVKVENASWFDEAWLAGTYANTTAKIGRMQLDTPLAFSEMWSVDVNTFEAAVLLNQDIPSTTVVLAYVGNGNGTEFFGEDRAGAVGFGYVNHKGEFATFGTDGAYAAGAINNSFEPLTVQAWYYDVTRLVQAYWLQADLSMQGVLLGAQYSAHELDTKTGAKGTDSNVFAVMAGYEMADVATLKVAYSSVAEDFAAGFNTATNMAFAQSKLYTEAWWNYGYITRADTSAMNVALSGSVPEIVDLAAFYTATSSDVDANEMTELTVTASRSFGPLDTSLVWIMADAEDQNDGDAYNIAQVYLTYNF